MMDFLDWPVRAALLSLLVSVGAWALDEALRGGGRATRFVWVGALVVSVSLPLMALMMPEAWPEVVKRPAEAVLVPVLQPTQLESASELSLGAARAPVGWSARDVAVSIWLIVSLLLVLRWLYGWQRLRRLRARWREAVLAGERVLVADRFGPALVGLLRPRVVIPSWLLRGQLDRQHMIVRHELEHARVGDQWLFALTPILIALFPWNPALWWQLRRLRVAIELDCDARVLRHGVSALDYGSMLLDVASSTTTPALPVLAALAEPRTPLERRIRAMTPIRHRFAGARATGLFAFCVLALVAAVHAGAPASAAVLMDSPVTLLESDLQQQEARPLVVLNGKPVAPTTRIDLAGLQIESIDVLEPAEAMEKYGLRARLGAVLITTRRSVLQVDTPRSDQPVEAAARRVQSNTRTEVPVEVPAVITRTASDTLIRESTARELTRVNTMPAHAEAVRLEQARVESVTAGDRVRLRGSPVLNQRETLRPRIYIDGVLQEPQEPRPMIFIDGVLIRNEYDVLSTINPDIIKSVEVIKGNLAVGLYGERAAEGVIHITTR